MLAVNLASKILSPNGYFLLVGDKKILHGGKKAAVLEHVGKDVVMGTAVNLSVDKFKEGVVWDNSTINTFACSTLIQERTTTMDPAVNHKAEWLSMERAAHMLKYYASGENRPINGTVFGLVNKGGRLTGRYVMPEFYN